MQFKKPIRTQTLLAVAFAGGLLNSQLPAWPQAKSVASDSVIQRIANSAQLQHERRAYELLYLATAYLARASVAAAEKQYKASEFPRMSGRQFKIREAMWTGLAEQISSEDNSYVNGFRLRPATSGDESKLLAIAALKQSLKQADQSSDEFARLNTYFIASKLFAKIGINVEAQRCNAVLEKAFQSCEGAPIPDEGHLKAAASVLEAMAYGIIPNHIPVRDTPQDRRPLVKSFSEEEFKGAEKIRLRVAAMVDRLDANSDIRRRVHRDLTLWYMQLGKSELAKKEKQTLFDLIGRSDDDLLYPQAGACGHLVWWQKKMETGPKLMCGMG
ncbi:MAG: hypothetical protein P4L53_27950 [Candidatus Obscuribacterales bacterium]|nr:hypothetical protein [Candidatus Obscuribacterales bacterium]